MLISEINNSCCRLVNCVYCVKKNLEYFSLNILPEMRLPAHFSLFVFLCIRVSRRHFKLLNQFTRPDSRLFFTSRVTVLPT